MTVPNHEVHTELDELWHGPRELTGTPVKFSNGYQMEMDKEGNFCVVDPKGERGDWTHYPGIAFSPNGRFLCVTAYWGPFKTDDLSEYKKDHPDVQIFYAETLYELKEVE